MRANRLDFVANLRTADAPFVRRFVLPNCYKLVIELPSYGTKLTIRKVVK